MLPSTTVDQTADSGIEGSRALSPTQEGQKRVHFSPPAMSAHAVLHADSPPTTTAAGQKRRDTGTRDHVEDEILGTQSSNELDEVPLQVHSFDRYDSETRLCTNNLSVEATLEFHMPYRVERTRTLGVRGGG